MTISPGHRFEATQALRQVLARAVVWGLINSNPGQARVENPQRRYTEKRPFESWAQLDELAGRLGPRYRPMVLFAAATGLGRASGWRSSAATSTARHESCTSVARSETAGSRHRRRGRACRAVPLQTIALAALDQLRPDPDCPLLFPSARGGYSRPAQLPQPRLETGSSAAGIEPPRRVYDLRHTFATFALRAGISTFDLSRYMGTSLAMIDRHYGHLARDGREHAIRLLDAIGLNAPTSRPGRPWTPQRPIAPVDNGQSA